MNTAQRLRDFFAKSFEPAGAGFLYRSTVYGAGIAIGADEHARLLEEFERRLVWLKWVCNPWLGLGGPMVFGIALQHAVPPGPLGDWAPLAGFMSAFAVPIGGLWWATSAPDRALRGRLPAVAALPRREARRREIAALPSRKAIWNVVLAALLVDLLIVGRHPTLPSKILAALTVPALALALYRLAAKAWAARRPAG